LASTSILTSTPTSFPSSALTPAPTSIPTSTPTFFPSSALTLTTPMDSVAIHTSAPTSTTFTASAPALAELTPPYTPKMAALSPTTCIPTEP
jgi:hypothetical protein